jgi:hypothetical protein
MIHAQHFPLERLYKRSRFKVEDYRKESTTVFLRASPTKCDNYTVLEVDNFGKSSIAIQYMKILSKHFLWSENRGDLADIETS